MRIAALTRHLLISPSAFAHRPISPSAHQYRTWQAPHSLSVSLCLSLSLLSRATAPGKLLLEAMDFIRPGCVEWAKVDVEREAHHRSEDRAARRASTDKSTAASKPGGGGGAASATLTKQRTGIDVAQMQKRAARKSVQVSRHPRSPARLLLWVVYPLPPLGS